MIFRTFRRIRVLAVSLAAVTATTTLFAIAGMAGPASAAAASSTCPASGALGGFKAASNVAATFSTSGSITTYKFSSLANENPVGGVPGLIKYCVYPNPGSQPTSTTVVAKGANGASWTAATGSSNFAFVRPTGDPSNIPLDGKTGTVMGTATWSTVPTAQTILLHINDPTVCTSIYGSGTSGTCFVRPSTGPICNAGDTNVAYNAMPTNVVDCYTASEAFEAQSVSEFGDEVGLAGTARNLVSLKVMFASYGCSVSGHWNTGDCVTNPGDTFTHPITANIYDPGNLTTPLVSVTVTQTIPYRPSADNVNCTGADAGKWFNTAAGRCQYSIGTVLTFNFPTGTTLPNTVVWTVAFNTSDFGQTPLRPQPCNSTAVGCGYDSLNVGTTSLPNAPYAGIDTDPSGAFVSSTWTGAYCDNGAGGTGFLRLDTPCWAGFRPLGEITTN